MTVSPTTGRSAGSTGSNTRYGAGVADIRVARFDDPDAIVLNEHLQKEYVERYGTPDVTHTRVDEFLPPAGLFLLGYLEGAPVAMGGWRTRVPTGSVLRSGDAEIKRMFVTRASRGRGLSRLMLAELERTAREAGRSRMVLETGTMQPEAIALYCSSGYTPMDEFGEYAGDVYSRYFCRSL